MTAVLSNQKIIDEIRDIQDSYIKTRPKMEMSVFKPTRFGEYNLGDERGGGRRMAISQIDPLSALHPLAPSVYKIMRRGGMMGSGSPAFQKHPLSYGNINGNTLHPDPLFSGVVYQKYKNTKGGALLEKSMPLTGESESDTDSGSESDEGGEIMSESSEGEFSSDDEGELGGRRKPARKVSNLIKTRQMAPAKGGSKFGDIAKQAGQAIYKVINTAEAKGLAEGAIKTAIMGVLTAYFGTVGTTVGAVGISEVDKLRKQFGKKDKGSGIVDNIKESAAFVKRKAKQAGDVIYKAVMSKEAQILGAAGLTLLITGILGKYTYDNRDTLMGYKTPRTSMLKNVGESNFTPHREEEDEEEVIPFGPFTKDVSRKEQGIIDNLVNSVVDKSASVAVDSVAKRIEKSPIKPIKTTAKYERTSPYEPSPEYLEMIEQQLGRESAHRQPGSARAPSETPFKTRKDRNSLVSIIMQEQGLTMPEASKYIKEHNLYG